MPETGTRPDSAQAADSSQRSAQLKTRALQHAMFASANAPIIDTDESGIMRPFNLDAKRMLAYDAPTFSLAASPGATTLETT